MFRRAVLIAAVAAGAAAPAAQAQTTLVVEAAAHVEPDGRMTFQCAAWDATTSYAQLDNCSFGPHIAYGWKNLPATISGGVVDPGGSYDLCVSATSHPLGGRPPVSVTKCAPYRPYSGQVLIGS